MSLFVFKQTIGRRPVLVSVGNHNGVWSGQAQWPKRSL
jgi:hypothetical protein